MTNPIFIGSIIVLTYTLFKVVGRQVGKIIFSNLPM